MFRIAHTRQNIITAFGTNTTTTLADISMLKQPAIKARDVEGALQETLIQEEDQRRQQVYSSRGRSEKTAGVFLKRKIREDSRRTPQEEDQRRQRAYFSRGRSEKTAGVFLKGKIREDSRRIPQEEDQRRQQVYSSRGRSEKTAGVSYSSRGRSEKTAGVFLKRKIREDSRHIPQLKKNNDQQALFGLRSAWFAVCECLC
jgi:hypothetical protein